MGTLIQFLKRLVAASVAGVMLTAAAAAEDQARLDELFAELATPDLPGWESVEEQIWAEWSRSGSSAMDLLLRRGREAMDAGETERAIEHFSALIDHAPDFAEAWNARATAYFRIERYGLSVADIQQVLTRNPRHFGALTGLGQIMEQLGYPKEALEAYRSAHELHPNRPDLRDAVERLERDVSGFKL